MKNHLPRFSDQNQRTRRSGLAPLEFVLSLPILLFVMGLMIIIGTAGAWKIRAQANSREAAWRSMTVRTGNSDPNPQNWPQNAEMELQAATSDIISIDPWLGYPVVRGPVVIDPNSGASLPVLEGTLDMTAGTQNGHALITRDYPVMKDMDPGQMTLQRDHQVLDGSRFQFFSMGLVSNISRRILPLYPLTLQGQARNLAQIFTGKALEIVFNPKKPELKPLEGGDPEIYALLGSTSPDFQPQLNIGYESATIPALRGRILRPAYFQDDPAVVRMEKLEDYQRSRGLKRQIRNVPRQMTSYYLGIYRSIKSRQENGETFPPSAAPYLSGLDRKIRELEQFQQTLPPP